VSRDDSRRPWFSRDQNGHPTHYNRVVTKRNFLVVVLVLGIGSQSSAHHLAVHDQNPNPPPPVLAVASVTFEAGSLIIPMDGCYARMSFMGDTEVDNVVKVVYESGAANTTSKVCNTSAQKDDAIIPSYSLVQRLMLDGIPVHWALRGSKTSFNDWDFKITKAGGGPVRHRDRLGGTDARYAGLVEIRYAGAPFIIDKADAPAAIAKIATYTQSSPGVDYDGVDFHEAQVSFTAPVYASLSTLPRVAIVDTRDGLTALGGQPGGYNNTVDAIDGSIMDDMAGTWFKFVSITDVNAGKLVTDGYQLVWVPAFDLSGPATPAQTTFLASLAAYVDTGGHILFQDGGVGALEGFGTFGGSYTSTQPTTTGYMTGAPTGGLLTNGTSGTFDNSDSGAGANETTAGGDYSDPASQWGGMVWTGIGGSKYNWQPRTDQAYQDGVRRMVFSKHLTDDTKSRWDFATWRYKDNNTSKGVIYYLGGDNWRRVTASGFRLLLNTIFVVAANGGIKEVSRATPVIAEISGTTSLVQGTFEFINGTTPRLMTAPADVTAFRFPFQKGHLRARKADGSGGSITTAAKTFSDGSVTTLFDAANGIPAVSAGGCAGATASNSCRVVWTTTVGGPNPPRVAFDTTNAATLGPIMTQPLPYAVSTLTSAEYPTLISRVLAGVESGAGFIPELGGVDRSTVAVIPASTVAKPTDGTTRAAIAYFGATDGMLHAVCASTQPAADGPCDVLGREIWAYIPRTILPELRLNTGRIDGSPRVEDLFGDFNGDGRREFKTVLMFQTADGDAAVAATRPAVYALDVTDPRNPRVLFEYTMDNSPGGRGAFELGRGLVMATGFVQNGAETRLYAFAQTANGGTRSCTAATDCAAPATDTCVSSKCVMADGRLEVAKAGSVVTAIDIETGAFVWQHDAPYPAPRTAGNPDVPETGMPGGVTRVDKQGGGFITDITFGTLYGDLWLLDPGTGKSRFDEINPGLLMYRHATDFHPIGAAPALFDDGSGVQYAVFGTGGFHDQEGGSWSGGADQYGGAISLETQLAELPLAPQEPPPGSTATVPPRIRFVFGFNAGEGAFSQALIVGTEVFFVTNSTNINGTSFGTAGATTGRATAMNSFGTIISQDTLTGGAASLVSSGTSLYTGSADKQQRTSFDQDGSTGKSVDGTSAAKVNRRLWLRTE